MLAAATAETWRGVVARLGRRVGLGMTLALGPWLAQAQLTQPAQQVRLAPSAAVDCLTPAAGVRGTPDYPFREFKSGQEGRVQVALRFGAADTAPLLDVLAQEADDSGEFLDAVKRHVAPFRVPCLAPGDAPATLVFDFVFQKDRRAVYAGHPTDQADPQRALQLGCVVHQSGETAPSYPWRARQSGLMGRVITRLRFTAPDQPPTAEFFARPAARRLVGTVEDWVAGYRMPCLGSAPVVALWNFVFLIEGSAHGFKPGLDLVGLLRQVRAQDLPAFDVDTSTMGCPFDLRWQYLQPSLPNEVQQLGSQDPARWPLIQTLSQVQLQLNDKQLDLVFGDTATVTVPCVRLALKR